MIYFEEHLLFVMRRQIPRPGCCILACKRAQPPYIFGKAIKAGVENRVGALDCDHGAITLTGGAKTPKARFLVR